ncbi:MAG: response regulator [Leptolyngbya sp. SIO1D8]|nr:response regulator [Leptolyngbya sp. SIO1D8]
MVLKNTEKIDGENLNLRISLPIPFNTIECQPITNEAFNSSQKVLQRLLTCCQERFSGCLTLTLPGQQHQSWQLYFLDGLFVGGTSKEHAVRRWYRQTARNCPELSRQFPRHPMDSSQRWDYSSLVQQVEQGHLSTNQLIDIVRGNLIEILFDFMQAHSACDRTSVIQLSYQDFCQKILTPPPVLVQPGHVLQPVMQAWNTWTQAGLGQYSPNLAPVIQDAEALKRQTSPSVYSNLTQLIDGDLTCRDLAVTLKQHLILLIRSIMPYVNQEIIGFQSIPDLVYYATPAAPAAQPQPLQSQSVSPLVAYLEDSRFDSMAMGQILEQAGYRFTNISDPLQALPMLLEQKPQLIFLDVLMPVLNGYEVCAQIRQISTFKDTPVIIVTSSDGIVDRVRAKLVGASDFLSKPITSEKVLATLQNHLPTTSIPAPVTAARV